MGAGRHEDGFGLLPTDDIDSTAAFAAWVARLSSRSDQATCRWIVEAHHVLGAIALRHEFTDYEQWAGHIGFGIRPSARGRGLAGWARGRMLEQARRLNMTRVLLVCASDNLASARMIERLAASCEEVRDTEFGPVRRYWIDL